MKKVLLSLMFVFLLSTNLQAKDILISFDGSDWLDRWQDTLDFAKETGIKFTYFVSAPYFKTESEVKDHPYWALTEDKRECLIKIRPDEQKGSIEARKLYVERAVKEGNEIASHLCGHYDGRPWTYDQWMKEFSWFKWALGDQSRYVSGCRAPYMCTSPFYFKALKDSGYKYDSSSTAMHDKNLMASGVSGIMEIPVRRVKVTAPGYKGWNQAPFDCDYIGIVQYQLFPDTKVVEGISQSDDPHILDEMKKIEDIFFDNLCASYLDGPKPMQICLHFQKRVGDSYIKAMKRFVVWVKDKDPRFMTYSEYYNSYK